MLNRTKINIVSMLALPLLTIPVGCVGTETLPDDMENVAMAESAMDESAAIVADDSAAIVADESAGAAQGEQNYTSSNLCVNSTLCQTQATPHNSGYVRSWAQFNCGTVKRTIYVEILNTAGNRVKLDTVYSSSNGTTGGFLSAGVLVPKGSYTTRLRSSGPCTLAPQIITDVP